MTFNDLEYQVCELRDKCIRFKENGNCKNTNCQKCVYQSVCNMWWMLGGMTIGEHIIQLKKLKSFHNGSYGASINFAIETMRRYQMFQADMVATLTDIQLEIEDVKTQSGFDESWDGAVKECSKIIQQKINDLRGNSI